MSGIITNSGEPYIPPGSYDRFIRHADRGNFRMNLETMNERLYHAITERNPRDMRSRRVLYCRANPTFTPYSEKKEETRKIHIDAPEVIIDAPNPVNNFLYTQLDCKNHTLAAVLDEAVSFRNDINAETKEFFDEDRPAPSTVCLDSNVPQAAVGDRGKAITLYNYERQEKIQTVQSTIYTVCRMIHFQRMFYAGGSRGGITALDFRSNRPHCWSIPKAHSRLTCGLELASNGYTLASGSFDGNVKIWDVRRYDSSVLTYSDHQCVVRAIAFCPDNSTSIATGDALNNTIKIWKHHTGLTIKTIQATGIVTNLLWRETYNELVSTEGNEINIRLSAKNFKHIKTLAWHKERILDAQIMPDKKSLVTLGADERINIWPIWEDAMQPPIERPQPPFPTTHSRAMIR